MSFTDESTSTKSQPSEPVKSNNSSQTSNNSSQTINTDNITGEQALALAKQAKDSGKTVAELLTNPDKVNKKEDSKTEASLKTEEKIVPKKYKVKVDGADLEVDETELLRGYAHQKAANKRFQEGQALRKQNEEFLALMKDPDKLDDVLTKLGYDPRELHEKRLMLRIEEELMDPKDKELRDARKKIKYIEDQEQSQQKAAEHARMEEMKLKYVKKYETEFVEALQKSDLPQTKDTIARMAKYIGRAAQQKYEISTDEAAQLVKEDIKNEQLSLIKNADGETLLKLFGDDVAAKILQARGSKVSKSINYNGHTEKGDNSVLTNRPKGKMTEKEWKEYNRK